MDDGDDKAFYIMKLDPYLIGQFNLATYAYYNSFFTLGMLPALLFLSTITESMNRKYALGICTVIMSGATFAHGLAREMWHLYVLIFIVGFSQGLVSAIPYQLPAFYFKKKQKIKAYYSFSLII